MRSGMRQGGQIALLTEAQADRVQLVIEDTGGGIAPEDLRHVSDRFYRGDASPGQEDAESRLGLSIARSSVEAHRGSIRVESGLVLRTKFMIAVAASM